ETWRWFGPNDPVTLDNVRQAGAGGVVTALHDRQDGRVPWPSDEVRARKATIEAAGLAWSVVESIPVPDAIKTGGAGADAAVACFTESLRAVGGAGVGVVCYNFMPVVDWTRTNLRHAMPSTGLALRFDAVDFAAYDAFILRREGAEADHAPDVLEKAEARAAALTPEARDGLERTIIAGLPGVAGEANDRAAFRRRLALYDGLDADDLRRNHAAFLNAVVPVAEEAGVRLAVHPDDPPFPLFGLPRVVSTHDDLKRIVDYVPSPANGLTLCVGSLSSSAANDVVAIADDMAPHVHFAHLRNVRVEPDRSFVESDHLDGRTDMVAVVRRLQGEERQSGRVIPMRPDHGHLLGSDIEARTNPGYSFIGRLKGLAELRGVMRALA
ncbi:MAG: mannonate dehydratase, partial [Geminicoccaceae bacterium]|nr:mannonate dehydratase [Geminicoccaceae bacterium]